MGEICQVIGIETDGRVKVRSKQRVQVVTLMTLEKSVEVGDWLVVHSGFALGWLDPEEAAEAIAFRETPNPSVTPSQSPAPAAPAPALALAVEHHPPFSSTEASP